MGRGLFKRTRKRTMPPGAEIVEKRGRTLARWTDGHGNRQEAPVTADGQHVMLEAEFFTGRYRAADGRLVEFPTGARTQDAAAAILRERENFEAKIVCGAISKEEAMVAGWAHIDIAEHISAWILSLQGRRRTERHGRDMQYKATRLFKECGFKGLQDMSRGRVERWIADRAEEGMPPRTRNGYLGAATAFCNWAIRSGRMVANPFSGAEKANLNVDRVKIRRALTPDELRLLLEAARSRPLYDATHKNRGPNAAKLTEGTKAALVFLGEERRMTYLVLATTGLRKSELASIRICDAHLDGAKPFLELRAESAKNRKTAKIPLRRDVADELVLHVTRRLKEAQRAAREARRPIPALLSPQSGLAVVPDALVKIFKRDCAHAGLPQTDARGRSIDVHALRTTFGSHLALAGIPLRTAQELMRHSDPKLTANVYQDMGILDTFGAVESLPCLSTPKDEARIAAQGGEESDPKWSPIWSPHNGKNVHFPALGGSILAKECSTEVEHVIDEKPQKNDVSLGNLKLKDGSGARIRTADTWIMIPLL